MKPAQYSKLNSLIACEKAVLQANTAFSFWVYTGSIKRLFDQPKCLWKSRTIAKIFPTASEYYF